MLLFRASSKIRKFCLVLLFDIWQWDLPFGPRLSRNFTIQISDIIVNVTRANDSNLTLNENVSSGDNLHKSESKRLARLDAMPCKRAIILVFFLGAFPRVCYTWNIHFADFLWVMRWGKMHKAQERQQEWIKSCLKWMPIVYFVISAI